MFEGGESLEGVLLQATSQDPRVLKTAEAKLMQCIDAPFFFLRLAELFMDKRVNEMVRWGGVLFFKNYIDRRLQPRSKLRLSDEEMTALMATLISSFDFPLSQLSEQLAMVTARVARGEFRRWPTLLPALLTPLKDPSAAGHDYALLTLSEVVKALASRRLSFDKLFFAQLSKEILPLVVKEWTEACEQVTHAEPPYLFSPLRRCHISLKILRLLLQHRGNKGADGLSHISLSILQSISAFIHLGGVIQENNVMQVRNKLLNSASKFLLESVKRNDVSCISSCLSGISLHCFDPEQRDRHYERVTVNLLNCIKTLVNESVTNKAGELMVGAKEVEWLLPSLLTSLLPYSPSELQAWTDDEETFLSDELGESDDVSLRACVESFLLTLVKFFGGECGRAVAAVLERCSSITQHSPLPQVLFKDMAYNSLGLSLKETSKLIDLPSLLHNHLIPDLSTTASDYRIVRRRVVWLLGRCLYEEATNLHHASLLLLLTPLLQTPRDLATQFEAVRTLRFVLYSHSFDSQAYQQYLEGHLKQLTHLMEAFTDFCLKKEVLLTLESLVPHLDACKNVPLVSQLLPHIYHLSKPHLASQAVATTTSVVQKLAGESVALHTWLLPLVAEATRIPSEDALWEDGVFLWLATVRCSSSLSPDLLSLFANMPPLLEHGTELIEVLMAITRAYLCIDADAFMQQWHVPLSSSVLLLLREVDEEGQVMIFKLLALMQVVIPRAVSHLFFSLLSNNITFVSNIDNSLEDKKGDLIQTHVVLWCRVVLHHHTEPTLLTSLLSSFSSQTNIPMERVGEVVWKGWAQCFEHLSCHKHLKLCALAMLSLLSSPFLRFDDRSNQTLSVCVDVLHRLCQHEHERYKDPYLLSVDEGLVFENADGDDMTFCNAWKQTIKKLSSSDVVFMTDLVAVVREGWQGAKERGEFIEYEVTKQLEHLLK